VKKKLLQFSIKGCSASKMLDFHKFVFLEIPKIEHFEISILKYFSRTELTTTKKREDSQSYKISSMFKIIISFELFEGVLLQLEFHHY